MPTIKKLAVFAHLNAEGFVPAAKLEITEVGTSLERSSLGYGTRYLRRPNAIEIDPVSLDLKSSRAAHEVVNCPKPLNLFGGIRDAAPDSWGRRVIEAKRGVPANSLAESDYLLEAGSNRVGALDIRDSINHPEKPSMALEADLGYLLEAAERIELGEAIPESLNLIFSAGTSLGGARPKANVSDAAGDLWIAKFPSANDYKGLTQIEAATVFMASKCNIQAPPTRILDVAEHKVMLIKRFDRANDLESKRIHRIQFNSALTFLGCTDMENASKSYADIADAIKRFVCHQSVKADQSELFRRMVFNIFVSNDDDHLRNHGFLYDVDAAGWRLSPVYDLMPRPNRTGSKERYLSLGVGEKGRIAHLENALSQSKRFGLSEKQALLEINRVWTIVRQWKNHFEEFGLPGQIIDVASSAMRKMEDISSSTLRKKILSAESNESNYRPK